MNEHGGRIANTAGDSVLAEFPSAVDPVECAVAVQVSLKTENESLEEGRRLRFRIGVHVGDVVVSGSDLLGDGVNVAARLQSIAEPGGACPGPPTIRSERHVRLRRARSGRPSTSPSMSRCPACQGDSRDLRARALTIDLKRGAGGAQTASDRAWHASADADLSALDLPGVPHVDLGPRQCRFVTGDRVVWPSSVANSPSAAAGAWPIASWSTPAAACRAHVQRRSVARLKAPGGDGQRVEASARSFVLPISGELSDEFIGGSEA